MSKETKLETVNVDTYVVLWSPHQKAFHIETVGEMLRHNRDIFTDQGLGDYIVLSFAKSHEEAHAIADTYKNAAPCTPKEAESAESITKRLFALRTNS